MLKKKYIGAVLAGALALGAWSGSAMATPVNVNGVMWDSSSPFDLTIQSLNLRESSVSNVGDTLMGYGQIGSINQDNHFCASCDLTFTFSYTVSDINGNKVTFDNGSFQFYLQSAGSYNAADPGSVGGSSWLTLAGHTAPQTDYSSLGQLYATVTGTIPQPGQFSGGAGLLDVTGGDAMPYIDSNTIADGIGGFADLHLNSEFQSKPASTCGGNVSSDPNDICHYPISGTGSLTGITAVPEPGTIGMLGLGLGFLGLAMRRRRKEIDNRA
ncbi:PEP-CTERM sorting domain-containing protein [Oleiagrimonas sp. C23AA]|uniref:PEP-CTERM sorting domain-containing protein n=1 Tax=Oleiagrimonas sp. C23AA TaxID=2719047 RepID=UPI0014234EBC|nr:PEP-CTERM sorting domain-containing protein [Oleiagrimonas sp. C23AA]NII10578.1 PEP-CTERM sorting domain-containing protein [Oleiagrimonas sp. C23AA]